MQDILNDNVDEKNAEANFISWYEEVVVERLAMLENEERFKKRIKELEQNNHDMTVALQESQNEIKHLRDKYEPSDLDLLHNEPYRDLCKEKERLLQKERALNSELGTLKDELRTLRDYVKGLETGADDSIPDVPKVRTNKHKGQGYVVITGQERVNDLESQNKGLKEKVDTLENLINKLVAKKGVPDEAWGDRQGERSPYDKYWKISPDSDKNDNYLPKINESRSPDSSLDSYDKSRKPHHQGHYSAPKRSEGASSENSMSDVKRGSQSSRLSDVTLPSIHRQSQSPGLLYGLDYVTLHKLKENSRKAVSSKSSGYSYI